MSLKDALDNFDADVYQLNNEEQQLNLHRDLIPESVSKKIEDDLKVEPISPV